MVNFRCVEQNLASAICVSFRFAVQTGSPAASTSAASRAIQSHLLKDATNRLRCQPLRAFFPDEFMSATDAFLVPRKRAVARLACKVPIGSCPVRCRSLGPHPQRRRVTSASAVRRSPDSLRSNRVSDRRPAPAKATLQHSPVKRTDRLGPCKHRDVIGREHVLMPAWCNMGSASDCAWSLVDLRRNLASAEDLLSRWRRSAFHRSLRCAAAPTRALAVPLPAHLAALASRSLAASKKRYSGILPSYILPAGVLPWRPTALARWFQQIATSVHNHGPPCWEPPSYVPLAQRYGPPLAVLRFTYR